MGGWLTVVAQAWLAYDLSHSATMLGIVVFASQAPVFLIAPFGGFIADRFDRRRALIFIMVMAITVTGILTALALSNALKMWHLVVFSLSIGFVGAMEVTVRSVMTMDMVGKADLRRALSLNAILFHTTRIFGPVIGGYLLSTLGVGICFLLDALSYMAVIVSLSMMRLAPRAISNNDLGFKSIARAFSYSWKHEGIRRAMTLVAVCGAFGSSYVTLLPAIAQDTLKVEGFLLGALYAAAGAGSVLGAYAIGRVLHHHTVAVSIFALLSLGVSEVTLGYMHGFALVALILVSCTFAFTLLNGLTNSMVQEASAEELRGRVVSIYLMLALGAGALTAPAAGYLAQRFGNHMALTAAGVTCIGVALLYCAFFLKSGFGLRAANSERS
jgi:MFS family permease